MFDIGFACNYRRSWKVFAEICQNNILKVLKRSPKDVKRKILKGLFSGQIFLLEGL